MKNGLLDAGRDTSVSVGRLRSSKVHENFSSASPAKETLLGLIPLVAISV